MKFDIVHTARQGQPFGPRSGLPAVDASQKIAAVIGIASLIALFVLAFVNLAMTSPALAAGMPADPARFAHTYDAAQMKVVYIEITHVPSGGKS